ncbi:MAG TPA: carbamoyltransferase HypF, partial [Verrucomicrobiae bacterium]
CTHCGPRFSLIETLPYDRANTTMRAFPMCAECQAEYEHPGNRRFHAQPNACPRCGPQLAWWNAGGQVIASAENALAQACAALRAGQIVAIKGVGGFHLMCDARNPAAVRQLRQRKQREEKPFAVMFPDLAAARQSCEISSLEAAALASAAGPIVLLRKRTDSAVSLAAGLAPGNANLGVMLPSNPLHHLLLAGLGFPVVATSGNLKDEPICIDEREALTRLQGVADGFLVHDRPMVRAQDDSILQIVLGRELLLRRARGYAPLPVTGTAQFVGAPVILAAGADLKNAVALAAHGAVFLSQHVGDLALELSQQAYQQVIADLQKLYGVTAETVVTDAHPDYQSSVYGRQISARQRTVQHHVAHVLACVAENHTPLPALGLAWDGTGLGPDGVIWGGEFFQITPTAVRRTAHLRPFRLPGGEAAIREPRRSALGVMFEIYGGAALDGSLPVLLEAFPAKERAVLRSMLQRGLNSPHTTSMGRLFDAVAALLGICQFNHFEGQAAMALEQALEGVHTDAAYHFSVIEHEDLPRLIDWQPMILEMLIDQAARLEVGLIAAKFHNALAELAIRLALATGAERVVLSGGCFQNQYLLERVVPGLRKAGLAVAWHHQVPPNDGGLALGQIYAAVHQLDLK